MGTSATEMTAPRPGGDKFPDVVSVKEFGAAGNDANDDSAAIQAAAAKAAATGAELLFPQGTYRIAPKEGQAFTSWTGKRNVRIRGVNAILHDVTIYAADVLTPIFLFDDSHAVAVSGIEYQGTALVSPLTKLGYLGATFVRAIRGSSEVAVKARIQNARYGVQCGEYADETKGHCRTLQVDVSTRFVGYPLAAYLADDVRAVINAEGFHRAAYLAGVAGGQLSVTCKDMYIAGVVVLLTDAKSGPGTSRGCSRISVQVKDTGSTVCPVAPALAGISLSRVDPGTTFESLDFHVEATSTDAIAPSMTAFKVISAANTYEKAYRYNWEPTICLKDIRVSGVVDKSAQKSDVDPTGLVYVFTKDSGPHFATVRGLTFRDLTLIPSSRNTRPSYVVVPGLQDQVLFEQVRAPKLDWVLESPATAPMVFRQSEIGSVAPGSVVSVRLDSSSIRLLQTTR